MLVCTFEMVTVLTINHFGLYKFRQTYVLSVIFVRSKTLDMIVFSCRRALFHILRVFFSKNFV